MKKLLFLLVLLFSLNIIYAQNIFLGTKSYPTTGIWRFKNADNPKVGSLAYIEYSEISIAKNNNSGMFIISTGVYSQETKLVGPVIVYFQNGKALSINIIKSRDYSDGNATAIFLLSPIQIKEFMKSDIISIRYNKNFMGISPEGITTFNSYEKFEGMNSYGLPYYSNQVNNTMLDVQVLFN
jgi:hypothetical protein